jgi:uncharacterized Zn finger protein
MRIEEWTFPLCKTTGSTRMERIDFLVQGSAATPYALTFERRAERIVATCSCPAGANGVLCKHRLAILNGQGAGIVSGNHAQVERVAAWLDGSELAADLASLDTAERALAHAKAALASMRKRVAAALRGPEPGRSRRDRDALD